MAPKPKNYELFCLVVGEENPFLVKIKRGATVDELKDAIKAKKQPALDYIAANELNLFKVEIPMGNKRKIEEGITALHQATAMSPGSQLNKCFSGRLSNDKIYILVQLPITDKETFRLIVLFRSLPPPHQGPRGSKRKASAEIDDAVAVKRAHLLSNRAFEIAPSTLGLEKRLDPDLFAFNRPPVSQTIPLALLNRIFAQFVTEADAWEPTDVDHALVRELRVMMSEIHTSERPYCAEFRRIVCKHYPDVPFYAGEIGPTSYTTDGHTNSGEWMVCVCEGSGEGDPEMQATEYLIASLRSSFNRVGDYPDMFPCMIVSIFGPYICFAGAVLTDRLQLETLTRPLLMRMNYHEDEIALQAARTLGAFRHAIQELQQHYQKLPTRRRLLSLPVAEMERLIFPYQSSFIDAEGVEINFTYVSRFHDSKLMFLANVNRSNILIKFTRRYSEDAHRHCAENNVAPKLHAVQRLAGGWLMAVMQYLDPTVYQCLLPPLNPALQEGIRWVVHTLHSGEFVHGDVRGPNVMVSHAEAGSKVMLVDFDWAGPAGTVRYPPNINPELFPAGVECGKPILKEHDLAMVDLMFK